MKRCLLLLLLLTSSVLGWSQPLQRDSIAIKDSTLAMEKINKAMAERMKAENDSMINKFVAKAVYPLIKASKFSGVMPVPNEEERPDVNQKYKLLMEVTEGIKDSTAAKEILSSLGEVGRIINIHIQDGIPKKNLNVVVVVHGGALKAFYNDENYNKNFHTNNPNVELFRELQDAGVKFIACGQAMNFLNIQKEEMYPWMKVALSAQTVLTNYQLKGYVLKKVVTE